MIGKSDCEKAFKARWNSTMVELKEFLSFASISADPVHHSDCIACAKWLARHLNKIGLSSRLLSTSSKPVVFAERKGRSDKPVVLFYGHYDVQPVDPLDAWRTPPFVPTLLDGRIYCRGAQDDKGQLFSVLKAIEFLVHSEALDCTIKVIIEGTEECSGEGIDSFLPKWKKLLKADILMVSDSGMDLSGAPAIVMGLRGVAGLTATLSGPNNDLHSGVHGGVAPNPAMAMARLLASVHKADGSIAIPGYYAGVAGPTRKEKLMAKAMPFNAVAYRKATGVAPIGGEIRFSPVERLAFRPTIEVNGIHAGYGGEGNKTIIPSTALAKLTMRFVAGQDPWRCTELLAGFLQRNAPPGLKLTVTEKSAAGPGFRLNPDSPVVDRAVGILNGLGRGQTRFQWCGASIPIVAKLATISGAEPLLVGFGREEDKIHAPNESYSIDQLRMGFTYASQFLAGR